jgi:hypothetical protein
MGVLRLGLGCPPRAATVVVAVVVVRSRGHVGWRHRVMLLLLLLMLMLLLLLVMLVVAWKEGRRHDHEGDMIKEMRSERSVSVDYCNIFLCVWKLFLCDCGVEMDRVDEGKETMEEGGRCVLVCCR